MTSNFFFDLKSINQKNKTYKIIYQDLLSLLNISISCIDSINKIHNQLINFFSLINSSESNYVEKKMYKELINDYITEINRIHDTKFLNKSVFSETFNFCLQNSNSISLSFTDIKEITIQSNSETNTDQIDYDSNNITIQDNIDTVSITFSGSTNINTLNDWIKTQIDSNIKKKNEYNAKINIYNIRINSLSSNIESNNKILNELNKK